MTPNISVSSELMSVQHKQALLNLELKQLAEREKFLKQNLTIMNNDSEETEEAEEIPAPKKSAAKPTTKKAAAQMELPESDDDEADLDDVFGSEEESDEPKAIGDDDIRVLLKKATSKGAVGQKKARAIMAEFTKNRSALVKDILKGAHAKIYAKLQKI